MPKADWCNKIKEENFIGRLKDAIEGSSKESIENLLADFQRLYTKCTQAEFDQVKKYFAEDDTDGEACYNNINLIKEDCKTMSSYTGGSFYCSCCHKTLSDGSKHWKHSNNNEHK